MPYRATFIYITHKHRAVSSYTNTSEGIWLLTATEQLWSIANINGISANATEINGRKASVVRLEHTWDKQINAMVTVTACKLYIQYKHASGLRILRSGFVN